ncbi:MAG TPA: hypothetical protein VFS30_17195 [Dehalococcoidia bacterium]|nr:hypothetical protein [Dehalococcoidia bacterium]
MTHKLRVAPLYLAMVIALLAVGAVSIFHGPPEASAEVTGVDASSNSFDSSEDVTITVDAEDFDGTLAVNTSEGELSLDSCSVPADAGDCSGSTSGSGTSSVSVDTDAADTNSSPDPLTLVLTLSDVNCETSDESVTISASQGDGEDQDVVLTCLAPEEETGSITIEKDTNPESSDVSFDFDGDLGDFDLEDDDSITFSDLDPDTYTVTEDAASDWELVDIECDSGDVSFSDNSVQIDLDSGDDVTCTFVNEEEDEDEDSYPSSVSIDSGLSSLDCGDSTFLTVTVTDSSGDAVEGGTVVSFSASLGSLSASSVATAGGRATVLYTAPGNTGGSAVISAYSEGVYGYETLTINCQAETPAVPVPTPITQALAPPSAGDGGLLTTDEGGSLDISGWQLAGIGIAFLIAVPMAKGALAFYRRRVG